MKITKQQLIEFNACKDGLARFVQQTNNTDEVVDVATLVGGYNTYNDLLWLAGKTIDKDRIVRFACDCALINIDLIKPYTDQINLISQFLRDPTSDAAAAYAAADTAYAADQVNKLLVDMFNEVV